jgi:hypothetical protein
MKYTKEELIEYAKQHQTGYGIDSAIAIEFIKMTNEIMALNEKIAVLEAHWD